MNNRLQVLRFLPFVILYASTCLAENAQIFDSTFKSSKCSYLDTDESQTDTFAFGKLMCCMCPKGTHYAGICSAIHPNTTVCKACEDGTYVEFDANLETKCHTKKPIACHPPLKYDAGTITEKPKCSCPLGMIEIGHGHGRRCIGTSKPTVTETTPSTVRSTKFPVSTTTEGATTTEAEITESTLMPRIVSSSTVQSSTTSEPLNDNHSKREQETTRSTQNDKELSHDKLDRDGGGTGINPAFVIIPCFVPIIILCIVLFCKYRCQTSTHHSDGKVDNNSDDGVPTDSRSPLIARRRISSTPPTSTVEQRRQGSENHATPSTGITVAQQPGFETSVPLVTPEVVEDRLQGFENPETLNLADPIRYSPQNRRTETDHSMQAPLAAPLLVVGMAETQQEDPVPLTSEVIERNRKFAREVATQFGSELPRNATLTVFRSIMGDHVNDVAIKDLQDEYKNDTPEFIYQLMVLSSRVKGSCLTPEYLLQKVKDTTPRLQCLVDIIEEEMNKPYMLELVTNV